MKKVSLTLCGLLVMSATAFAHPPSDIKIQFDPATRTLTATVKHRVSNPKTHYIRKIDIGLNGKELKMMPFTRQETSTGQALSCVVPQAQMGDTLSVEGYCNLSGKLEKEIKVT